MQSKELTFPIKQIDAIKSPSKVTKGFVKPSNHDSYKTLPRKHIIEGFDPISYKLLVKVGHNPDETSKLGKVPHEVIEKAKHGFIPTQRILMERWYMVKQSREGLNFK